MAPPVQAFRSSFAKFAFVNAVILIVALISDTDFLAVTVIWGIIMASKYSRLWSAGYDWRDVFRQPRDRRLVDVASESIDDARGLFDRNRRALPRPPRRPELPPGDRLSAPAGTRSSAVPASAPDYGAHAATVQQAERTRDELVRLIAALPRNDQRMVSDVVPAATALVDRIASLARSLAVLERSSSPSAMEEIDAQIALLESQANPLDYQRSEERVRRLALLKRQRRAVVDARGQQEGAAAKLESCVLALQNMRLDVLRLRAGGVAAASEHITLLTERARSLAEDVDAVVAGSALAGRPEKTTARRRERDRA
jgi:serine/threonine-protein kinase